MKVTSLLCLFFALGVTYGQQTWSNFNCPAPRSPKNGLSFIFQQGKEVHFKCHPGHTLIGNPIARCLNNIWDSPVPDCVPEKDGNVSGKDDLDTGSPMEDNSSLRPLFSWDKAKGEEQFPETELTPGSRRLPLINGLWKPRTQGHNVQSTINKTGRPSSSANRTRNHYDQELSIAEVRQRQQDEMQMNSVLRGSEHFPRGPPSRENARHRDAADRRRWRIVEARQSPNILYAGSRAASAYRGETDDDNDLDTSGTLMGMFNWAEAPHPPSEIHFPQHFSSTPAAQRSALSNDELIELRQKQIAEALQNQMAANQVRGRNSDKAGLVEDARKRQYEDLQLLRNNQKPVFVNQGHGTAESGFNRQSGNLNFVRRAHLTGNDYLLESGTEQDEKLALPSEGVSLNLLKPVIEEEVNVFKPTFYGEVETTTNEVATSTPLRGDMGIMSDDITETPELMEFTRQYSEVSQEPDVPHNMQMYNPHPNHNRASFSTEKAAQVEATIRRFLRPHPGVIVQTVYQPPPTVKTYHSNLVPKVPPTRPPTRPPTVRPPTRPPVWQPTRSPVMEANGDKAAQTEEALYQQYLQAEHLRRIMEYERERLEWERRREMERRYIMEEERRRQANRRSALTHEEGGTGSELVQKPEEEIDFPNSSDADLDYANRVAVLSSIDREWLSQLSPDLQARYLEEILNSRQKESDESQHAQDFMRRHLENSVFNSTFPNVSTRTSASGHVTTIIQSQTAASLNGTSSDVSQMKADMSCLQSRSGRRLFIRAPKVPFAFVYRYEKKKHSQHPFRPYLIAEYRCRRGYTMTPLEKNSLFCRRMEWVGEKPRCVQG